MIYKVRFWYLWLKLSGRPSELHFKPFLYSPHYLKHYFCVMYMYNQPFRKPYFCASKLLSRSKNTGTVHWVIKSSDHLEQLTWIKTSFLMVLYQNDNKLDYLKIVRSWQEQYFQKITKKIYKTQYSTWSKYFSHVWLKI